MRNLLNTMDLPAPSEHSLKPRVNVLGVGISAITMAEALTGRPMDISYAEDNRVGDHIWWISDVTRFKKDYPEWEFQYDLPKIVSEIIDGMKGRI